MELTRDEKQLNFCENVCDIATEQAVDADLSFPDYCPDIVRVLSCTVETGVSGVAVTGGRITADCKATVRLIYVGPDEQLAAYDYETAFQASVDEKKADKSCAVSVKLKADYVNCRAVSPRRAEVHASLTCRFRADRMRSESVLSAVEGAGIQFASGTAQTVQIIGKTVRYFPMSEVAALEENRAGIAGLISVCAEADKGDIKVINNKLLLKGSLNVRVFYLGEDGSVSLFEHTMPISQIMEMEGLTDNAVWNLELSPSCVEVLPKADSSGAVRLMDISAAVEATLSACAPVEIPLIHDMYSTAYELKTESRALELCRYLGSIQDRAAVKSTVSAAGSGIECVLAAYSGKPTAFVTVGGGYCTVNGSFEVSFLCRGAEGSPVFLQRTLDYEYKTPWEQEAQRFKSNLFAAVRCLSCAVPRTDTVEVKAEVEISASLFAAGSAPYIASVTAETEKPAENAPALTVYYSEPGESVWSIAKRYGTTVQSIAEQNGLEDDTVKDGGMLLIPGAV